MLRALERSPFHRSAGGSALQPAVRLGSARRPVDTAEPAGRTEGGSLAERIQHGVVLRGGTCHGEKASGRGGDGSQSGEFSEIESAFQRGKALSISYLVASA